MTNKKCQLKNLKELITVETFKLTQKLSNFFYNKNIEIMIRQTNNCAQPISSNNWNSINNKELFAFVNDIS